MAKISKSVSFKNAVVSKKDGTITEYNKDDYKTYSLSRLIDEWDGVEELQDDIETGEDE